MTKFVAPAIIFIFLTAAATGTEPSADPFWSNVKLIAVAVKEILLGLGILIGGGWAVYQYIYLNSYSAQRRAKLKDSPPNMNITINHELFERDDGSYNLVGDVVMEHVGTGEIYCDLDNTPPITICRLASKDDGEFNTHEGWTYPRIMSTENFQDGTMYPKSTWSLKFIEKVEEKQVYLIEFKSRIAEKLMNEDGSTASADPKPEDPLSVFTSWISTEIIHVGFSKVKEEEENIQEQSLDHND